MTQITLSITADSADELKVAINGLAGITSVVQNVSTEATEEPAKETTPVTKAKETKPKKASAASKSTKPAEEPVEEEEKETTEDSAEVAEEEEAEVTPSVDVEQIRALAPVVAKSKGKVVLKDLLEKYDASSISTLAKEHYDAFYAELEALNG